MPNQLALQLHDVKSAMYERMPHAAKLDLVTIGTMIELVSQGYQIHTSLSSKRVGILNELSIPPISFHSWLLTQDSRSRDDLNSAMMMQSLALKNEMLDAAVSTVEELGSFAEDVSVSDATRVKALSGKAATALKVLDALSVEHDKTEKQAPTQAMPVQARITSSDEAREKLLKLRKEKEDAT